MSEVKSQQGAVVVFLSLFTLCFICAMCLRCRKKTRIVQENDQLYVPHVFHREGSKFAVTRSKTVTKTNKMSEERSHSMGDLVSSTKSEALDLNTQSSYQNIPNSVLGTMEPTYVRPIATPPSKNTFLDNDDYENVFPTQTIEPVSENSVYENTQFLQNSNEDDDPDYENETDTRESSQPYLC